MSHKLISTNANTPAGLGGVAHAVTDFLKMNRPQADTLQRVISGGLESADAGALTASGDYINNVRTGLVDAFAHNMHDGLESALGSVHTGVLDQAVAVGQELMMMGGDLRSFYTRQGDAIRAAAGRADVKGIRNLANYALQDGNESFDFIPMPEFNSASVAYSVQAPVQDAAADLLFKPVACSGDQGGIEVVVNPIYITRPASHSLTGKPVDFNRVALARARVDSTLLIDDSTRMYPVVVPTGANANLDKFVAAAKVAAHTETVATGIDVSTAPLALGVKIDFLGLSQTEALVAAGIVNTESDSFDGLVQLDNIYLNILGSTEDKTVQLKTRMMPRSQFQASREDGVNNMDLSFNNNYFMLNKDTVDVTGGTLAALNTVIAQNLTVVLSIEMAGSLLRDMGTVRVNRTICELYDILDSTGKSLPSGDSRRATVATELGSFDVIGYDLLARRSNSNMRTKTILLDTNPVRELYLLYRGNPIYTQIPPTEGIQQTVALNSMVAASHMQNSLNAMNTLTEAADWMIENQNLIMAGDETALRSLGIGRVLVTPYIDYDTFNVFAQMNSIRSQDREEDVSASLTTFLRKKALNMYLNSNYATALMLDTGSASVKATVAVVTDDQTGGYIFTTGDSRTFGDMLDFKIATTVNLKIRNRIFMTFVRPNVNKADPLSFGIFGFSGQVIGKAPATRMGGISVETAVMNVTRHAVLLPVLTVIDVIGLAEATMDKTDAPQVA